MVYKRRFKFNIPKLVALALHLENQNGVSSLAKCQLLINLQAQNYPHFTISRKIQVNIVNNSCKFNKLTIQMCCRDIVFRLFSPKEQ